MLALKFRPRTMYVPPGGFGFPDGQVLTRVQVADAVNAFAARNGTTARAVRALSFLFQRAMREYVEGQGDRQAA